MKIAAGKLGDTQQLFQKELKVSCSSLRTLQVLSLGSVPQTLGAPMDSWGDTGALQVRDAQAGPWEQCCRAATLTQPWESWTSSQRGESCSCRTWKSGLKEGRGDLPSMVTQGPTALSFIFHTPHLSNTRLEHMKFLGFYLIFQSVVYFPSYQHSLLSSVQRLRSACWWKLFWERVKPKQVKPKAHLQSPQQEFKGRLFQPAPPGLFPNFS